MANKPHLHMYILLWVRDENSSSFNPLLFLQEARSKPLLYSMLQSGTWVKPELAVLIPAEGRGLIEPEDADADAASLGTLDHSSCHTSETSRLY